MPMTFGVILWRSRTWKGAGRAHGHGDDVLSYYEENGRKMVLSYSSRRLVERELGLRRCNDGSAVHDREG